MCQEEQQNHSLFVVVKVEHIFMYKSEESKREMIRIDDLHKEECNRRRKVCEKEWRKVEMKPRRNK